MVKVGIIGAGGMGTGHVSCISKMRDAKVVAIADIDIEKARSLASICNAEVLDADSLINSKDVDAVFVCLPTSAHSAYVIKSAKAGKHVFVEKPLARTLQEAKEMINATKKVKFMVGHVLRFFPEYKKVKEIFDSGVIGKPGVIRTTRGGSCPGKWYLDVEHGAGVVLDLIIHDIDFLRWCLGDAKRVYAKGLIYKKPDNMDYALLTIRFKNGAIAHVEGTWAHQTWRTKLEIAGSKGLIKLDSDESSSLKVEVNPALAGGDAISMESPIAESPLSIEDEHFFECINTGKNPLTSGEESYKSLEISLAALDSIKDDKVVNI